MKNTNQYKRYRFPSEIIQYAVWLYYRFNLSHRDIEDLLAERRINVSYEAIRLWCIRFGPKYAARLKKHHDEPRKIVTDKLRSYGVAHRELIPDTIHDTSQYANNRAELSHQPTRVRERGMRRFKSVAQAQRFLAVHSAMYNLFNLGRHLISARHYRLFRLRALASWKSVVG
jgi:putative transposase